MLASRRARGTWRREDCHVIADGGTEAEATRVPSVQTHLHLLQEGYRGGDGDSSAVGADKGRQCLSSPHSLENGTRRMEKQWRDCMPFSVKHSVRWRLDRTRSSPVTRLCTSVVWYLLTPSTDSVASTRGSVTGRSSSTLRTPEDEVDGGSGEGEGEGGEGEGEVETVVEMQRTREDQRPREDQRAREDQRTREERRKEGIGVRSRLGGRRGL